MFGWLLFWIRYWLGIQSKYSRRNLWPITFSMNAYTEAGKERLRQDQENQICPFCSNGLKSLGRNRVFDELLGYCVIDCTPSYRDVLGSQAQYHFLIIPKWHTAHMSGLIDNIVMGLLLRRLRRRYGFRQYILLEREGEDWVSGKTYYHKHRHIIVGNVHPETKLLVTITLHTGVTPPQP